MSWPLQILLTNHCIQPSCHVILQFIKSRRRQPKVPLFLRDKTPQKTAGLPRGPRYVSAAHKTLVVKFIHSMMSFACETSHPMTLSSEVWLANTSYISICLQIMETLNGHLTYKKESKQPLNLDQESIIQSNIWCK